jgi:hypothetical protein
MGSLARCAERDSRELRTEELADGRREPSASVSLSAVLPVQTALVVRNDVGRSQGQARAKLPGPAAPGFQNCSAGMIAATQSTGRR